MVAVPELTLDGTAGDDTMTLAPHATSGWFTLTGGAGGPVDFELPTTSLIINGGDGVDSITLTGALAFGSTTVTIRTEAIVVAAGASVTTTGDINLLAESIDDGTTDLLFLTSANPSSSVAVDDATLSGNNVTISSTSSSTTAVSPARLSTIDIDATSDVRVQNSSITSIGATTLASTTTVTASAPAEGMGGIFGTDIDAAVAIALIDIVTMARILGTSQVTAGGALSVTANSVTALASMGDAGATTAGAVIATANVDERTQAWVSGATDVTADSMLVAATSDSDVESTAEASTEGAEADADDADDDVTPTSATDGNADTQEGTVDVAGAVAFARLVGLTQAWLDGTGSSFTTTNGQAVRAHSKRRVVASADGSVVGETATGVGVAVAVGIMDGTTQAWLAGTLTLDASDVTVEANAGEPTDTLEVTAVSGQGDPTDIGVAGALAVGVATATTAATITNGATVTDGGANSPLTLTAANALDATVEARAADTTPTDDSDDDSTPNVGIGASVAVNVVAQTTRAGIEQDATLIGGHDLTVAATTTGTHRARAVAGSAGGTAITPVVAIMISNADTVVLIGPAGAAQVLTGAASLAAVQAVTATADAEGDAVGSDAAIGAAIAIAIADHLADAAIQRDLTAAGPVAVSATNSGGSAATADASANGAPADGDPDAPAGGVNGAIGDQQTFGDTVADSNGASNSGGASAPPAQDSQGNSITVAAAVAVTLLSSQASATIPVGVTVAAGSGLELTSRNDADATSSADATSTAARAPPAAASIGAAVAITTADVTNIATVAGTVSGPTTVRALMTDTPGDGVHTFGAQATSGAGGGQVSVAGAFALTIATVTTDASVTGTVGDLTAQAASAATTTTAALPATDEGGSGEDLGLGASIAIGVVNDTTTARLADDAVASGDIDLTATQSHTTATTARTGAAGSVAVAAAVAVTISNVAVAATIGSGTSLAADSVAATATQTVVAATTAAGSANTSGDAAIGAAIAVGVSDHTATATTGRDLVVLGAVSFSATSDATTTTSATASTAGAPGEDDADAPSEDVTGQVNDARGQADGLAPAGGDSDAGSSPTPEASTSSGPVSVAAAIAVTIDSTSATASVAAARTIQAGTLTLAAGGQSTATSTADGSAATTDGGTSIGAAVALTVANLTLDARVAGTVTAGSLTTSALVPTMTNHFGATATSGAGGGDTGVAGSVAIAVVTVDVDASLTGTATISGDVALTASSTSETTVEALASDGASGTDLGIGASVAVSVVNDTVAARIADGGVLTGAADLTLSATQSHLIVVTARNSAAGATAVTPVIAISVSNLDALAGVGTGGGGLVLTGDLSATADQTAGVTTTAEGDATGGTAVGIALGLSVANHVADASVQRGVTAVGFALSATSNSTVASTGKAGAAGAPEDDGGGSTVDSEVAEQRTFADGRAPAGGDSDAGSNPTPSAETSEDGGTQVSVGAGIAITISNVTASASIPVGITVIASGAATLAAAGTGSATATGDGSAATNDGGTSVGVAVALTVANAMFDAAVAGTLSATSLTTSATQAAATYGASATSGAGGGDIGVAGSVAIAIVSIDTTAAIVGVVTITGGGDVSLTAGSTSTTTTEAVPAEFDTGGADLGIGASFALAIVNDTTAANLANGALLTGAAGLTLSATQSHTIVTTARTGAGAAAGGTGIAAAIAITISNLDALAGVGTGGGGLVLTGDLAATADQTAVVTTTAEGDATGGTAVGIALGLSVREPRGGCVRAAWGHCGRVRVVGHVQLDGGIDGQGRCGRCPRATKRTTPAPPRTRKHLRTGSTSRSRDNGTSPILVHRPVATRVRPTPRRPRPRMVACPSVRGSRSRSRTSRRPRRSRWASRSSRPVLQPWQRPGRGRRRRRVTGRQPPTTAGPRWGLRSH